MSKAILDSVDSVSTPELTSNWHEAPRGWGHSLHTLSAYVGGFPPALARYFIKRYSNEGDVVLDPFCGGGTTALEAGLTGRKAAANDAFSYAYVLTKAKCNPISKANLAPYLRNLMNEAVDIPNSSLQLDNDDISVFYSESTLNDILALRHQLMDETGNKATFIRALVCGILHGPSENFLSVQTKDTYSGSANYVEEYIEKNGLKRPDRDIEHCIWKKHDRATEDGLPQFTSTVTQGDARELEFNPGSVDFVLTSPPYMHMLDYSWNNWIRLWWLGADRKQERDSLDITADVDKYRSFINSALGEMYTVLKSNSRAVLVVGDAKKHRASGTKIVRTGQIIAEEAADVGFQVDHVVDDTYDVEKRSYVRFNELRNDSPETYIGESEDLIERCIVLNKGEPETDNNVSAPWFDKTEQSE